MANIPFSSEIKKLPKGMRELNIGIAAPEVETCFKRAVERLSRDLEIEGFRKGKVPPAMAEKYIRADAILEEAAHIGIENTYPEVVQHHEIEPVGRPEFEVLKISRNDEMKYRIKVAVLGETELPEWRKISVKLNPTVIDDAEVQKSLDYLQKSRATYTAASRPAAKGDFVEVDFTIRLGGAIIENGTGKNHPFVLGEGRFIPGFEDGVLGMSVNDEKNFSLTFPNDWNDKNYAGKLVDCTVKLVSLLERKLPEKNDAFAQSIGNFKTLEELNSSVREGIKFEKEEHEIARARMEAVEKIAEKAKMEIPDVLIEREIEKMFEDLESRMSGAGLTLEQYLSHLKKTREELAKDWREEAGKRVKFALTLRAIARSEKIQPAEEEIKEKMQETVKNMPSPKEAKKQYNELELHEYAENVLANEKVLELIEKECVVKPAAS
jgi:trigger factor